MGLLGNIATGLVGDVVIKTIRGTLNGYLRKIPLSSVVKAVQNDLSLWEVAGGDIQQIIQNIPPHLIQQGLPMYRNAVARYGSATGLVLEWVREDNYSLYSLIANTPGGLDWLDRQVQDMTRKLGLDYK